MKCDKCGYKTQVVETREKDFAIARVRECGRCGNRFKTQELHRAVGTPAVNIKRFTTAANRRLKFYDRDKDIFTRKVAGYTWQQIARVHNITKGAVHYAAKRGKQYIMKEKQR